MGLALGALSGILSGLQGLPKGMAEGTQADQRQQQIDLQRRQLEEGNSSDWGAITPILKAGGMDVSTLPASGRVKDSLIPPLLSLAQKKAELARTDTIDQGIAEQVRQAGTTVGMAPGASVEMPQPGAMLAPPPSTPMPTMTQKTVNPKMAALANMIPGLLKRDVGGATALLKDAFVSPKPSAPHYIEGPSGEVSAVTIQGGAPTVTPVPGVKGKGMESRALTTRADIERQLRNEGLQPGTPKWDRRYLEYSQPTVPVPDIGIFSKPDAVGAPRVATAPPPGGPDGNRLRQQAAETTNPRLKEAYLEAATAADRATGSGGAPPQGAQGPRTAGAPGGPQPSLAFPKKPLSPDDAGALGVPYGTKKEEAYGKTPLLAGQRTKMDAQASVLAMIDNMEGDLKGISQPKGPMDRLLGIPKAVLGVKGQTDPKLAAFHSRIESTLALVVRALGEVGTLTDGDIQRARNLQPTVYPVPDTEDVVREKMQGLRRLVQEVAARTGSRPENMGQPGPAPSGGAVKWGRDPKTGNPVRLQ